MSLETDPTSWYVSRARSAWMPFFASFSQNSNKFLYLGHRGPLRKNASWRPPHRALRHSQSGATYDGDCLSGRPVAIRCERMLFVAWVLLS
jgi:hypothetical protein